MRVRVRMGSVRENRETPRFGQKMIRPRPSFGPQPDPVDNRSRPSGLLRPKKSPNGSSCNAQYSTSPISARESPQESNLNQYKIVII